MSRSGWTNSNYANDLDNPYLIFPAYVVTFNTIPVFGLINLNPWEKMPPLFSAIVTFFVGTALCMLIFPEEGGSYTIGLAVGLTVAYVYVSLGKNT